MSMIYTLKKLSLTKCNIQPLPSMPAPNLTHLYLKSCTGLADPQFHFLLSFPELTFLEMADMKEFGAETLGYIAKCKKLVSFFLHLDQKLPSYSIFKCLGESESLKVFQLTTFYKDCFVHKQKFLGLFGNSPWLDTEVVNLQEDRPSRRRFSVRDL